MKKLFSNPLAQAAFEKWVAENKIQLDLFFARVSDTVDGAHLDYSEFAREVYTGKRKWPFTLNVYHKEVIYAVHGFANLQDAAGAAIDICLTHKADLIRIEKN